MCIVPASLYLPKFFNLENETIVQMLSNVMFGVNVPMDIYGYI